MTSSISLQPHLPGHEPASHRSAFWRVAILAVLGLSIVAGIVYGVFNHKVTNVTPPPTLGGIAGADYSGSFIGTGANGKSYLAFDEADKTAFAAGKATLVAATPNPAPLAVGVNYMYADSAMTMKDIITRIDPSKSAKKLVVAFYTPGGETGVIPNASTVKGFYAFPNGAYAGTNQITSATTFDATAKSDLTNFTVPARRVFIVVVDGATEIYGVHDTSKPATAVGDFSSLTSDWIQVAGSTTVEDTVAPYKCQIASVWAQNRLWAADGASDYSLVTLNTTTDTTKNHALTTFHTLWVNLKPAPVGGCVDGSTPGNTQDLGTTPPPAIEGLSVNITVDGPAVNWIPGTPDAKTSDLTDGTKYYYNYRWELTEKGSTTLLWSKNWEEAFAPLTTGDVQPELKHKKDSNKKFKNLWVGNTFIIPQDIQKKLIVGEYTITLYRGNGTEAVSATKNFTVDAAQATQMGSLILGGVTKDPNEPVITKAEPTIKKKTKSDAVRNVKFEKVAGQDITATTTGPVEIPLADVDNGLSFSLKDPNTSSYAHLTKTPSTYVMTYQWTIYRADLKANGNIVPSTDVVWQSTRGVENLAKGEGVFPYSMNQNDPCKYEVSDDGFTATYMSWVCRSANIPGSMLRDIPIEAGYYTLEGAVFDSATDSNFKSARINIKVVAPTFTYIPGVPLPLPEVTLPPEKISDLASAGLGFAWSSENPSKGNSYLTDGKDFYYNYMWKMTKDGENDPVWIKDWLADHKTLLPTDIHDDLYLKDDTEMTKLSRVWTANLLVIPDEVQKSLTDGAAYSFTLYRGNGKEAVSATVPFIFTAPVVEGAIETPLTIAEDLKNLKIIQDKKDQYRFTIDTSGLKADYSKLFNNKPTISYKVTNPQVNKVTNYPSTELNMNYAQPYPNGIVSGSLNIPVVFNISNSKKILTCLTGVVPCFMQTYPIEAVTIPPLPPADSGDLLHPTSGTDGFKSGAIYHVDFTITYGGVQIGNPNSSYHFKLVKP